MKEEETETEGVQWKVFPNGAKSLRRRQEIVTRYSGRWAFQRKRTFSIVTQDKKMWV